MKIAIIGYGRFGKLFASVLKPLGQMHALTENEVEEGIGRISLEGLIDMDMVVPAVPISAFKETLLKIKPHLKSGVILMDVCSVKVYPCEWLLKYAPADAELLGSHPMFGPDSAKNGLENLQMVFTPLRIKPEIYERIKTFFAELKLKIIETTAEDHDKQAAACLALVHFIGRGLGRMDIGKQTITTLGFERLLAVNETVNNDTWQLFYDMQIHNPFAAQARSELLSAFKQLDNEVIEKENRFKVQAR